MEGIAARRLSCGALHDLRPSPSELPPDAPLSARCACHPFAARRLPLGLLVVAGCAGPRPAAPPPVAAPALSEAEARAQSRAALADLLASCARDGCAFDFAQGTDLDTLAIDAAAQRVDIRFNEALAYRPFRPATVDALNALVRERLAPFFPGYDLRLWSKQTPVEALVPNYYRADAVGLRPRPAGARRGPPRPARPRPRPGVDADGRARRPLRRALAEPRLVLRAQAGPLGVAARAALPDRRGPDPALVHAALPRADAGARGRDRLPPARARPATARSHRRQRRRRCGATPRPGRGGRRTARASPSARGPTPRASTRSGSARTARPAPRPTRRRASGGRRTSPRPASTPSASPMPATRRTSTDASYTVYHAGGATRFEVNQQIGGGTWVYLGTFRFEAGRAPGLRQRRPHERERDAGPDRLGRRRPLRRRDGRRGARRRDERAAPLGRGGALHDADRRDAGLARLQPLRRRERLHRRLPRARRVGELPPRRALRPEPRPRDARPRHPHRPLARLPHRRRHHPLRHDDRHAPHLQHRGRRRTPTRRPSPSARSRPAPSGRATTRRSSSPTASRASPTATSPTSCKPNSSRTSARSTTRSGTGGACGTATTARPSARTCRRRCSNSSRSRTCST